MLPEGLRTMGGGMDRGMGVSSIQFLRLGEELRGHVSARLKGPQLNSADPESGYRLPHLEARARL